ncbi:hypothetical protein IMZ29_12695 [Achromobacter sp. GG226]|uniref:hypothetical protein n=1 Tax=Verticiella alkaliphila TaxID=2779529 RepID=UPI001C0D8749|nr:hypothetical protein [Verticiella sp. GG226]MBU4611354.1 hypothetical protein [Verticiella sp. GG226]
MASPTPTHSARAALQAAHAAYPQAWQMAEAMRETRGRPGIPDWPAWCYLPMAGWYAAVARVRNGGRPLQDLAAIGDVSRLAALGTWRMTQGIYRLDEAVREQLDQQGLPPDVPCSALHHLPQWCVYVETPGGTWQGATVAGFWAHLECDANDGGVELRLLLDGEKGLQALAVPLSDGPLQDALDAASGSRAPSGPTTVAAAPAERAAWWPWILPLLHLADAQAVFRRDGNAQRPVNPSPRKTKRGLQMFAAASPVLWQVA